MDKKKKLIIISIVIIVVSVIISHLFLSNAYTSRTIQDELTGYEFKTYRSDTFMFHPPRLILVFGESEIDFELQMSNFVNWTPIFNGITIQEFKNNDVRIDYDENYYGYRIIRNMKFN